MSTATVVGLWLAEMPAPAARQEALRTLVAARAAGRDVVLLDLRPAPGAAPQHLTDDEQRWLDALAQDGVSLQQPSTSELRTALERAGALVPLADPARARQPDLLWIDAIWARTTPIEPLRAALQQAGQIVRRAP